MFYFSALTDRLGQLPEADPQIRHKIENDAQRLGWPMLHEQLKLLDPEVAQRIHHNDRQRIQRALEIHNLKRQGAIAMEMERSCLPDDARIIRLGLAFADRSFLHNKIEQRVDQMLKSGFLSEVNDLVMKGVDPHTPALRSIGYRQVYQYLNGEFDYSRMRERIISATRQFAKRQLTWMRNTAGTVWFDAADRHITQSVGSYLKACLADQN